MPSWLDAIPAVPLIGIRTRMPFAISLRLADLLAPTLDAWPTRTITVGNPFQIETNDDTRFRVQPDNLVGEGALSFQAKQQAGSFFPEVNPVGLRPYGEVLGTISERVGEILGVLALEGGIEAHRIGVVAHMRLRQDTLPDGFTKLINHLGSPFPGRLLKSETMLLAELGASDLGVERCHHQIVFDSSDDDAETAYRVSLDWQVTFPTPMDAGEDAGTVLAAMKESVSRACNYFEEAAFGAD